MGKHVVKLNVLILLIIKLKTKRFYETKTAKINKLERFKVLYFAQQWSKSITILFAHAFYLFY